jgi:hypothetical protein
MKSHQSDFYHISHCCSYLFILTDCWFVALENDRIVEKPAIIKLCYAIQTFFRHITDAWRRV